jgi:integrase
MARRGPNEGTIRLRRDGRWEARVVVTELDGRRLRRSLLGRDRATVRAKLRDALAAEPRADTRPSPISQQTLGEYLEVWLRDTIAPSRRPSTHASYASMVHVHLIPGLGSSRLPELTAADVQAMLNAKSAAGLAPRSVAYQRAVLRQALAHAERWGLVERNVARLTVPPRQVRHEVQPFTPDQARTFLAAIEGDRHEALYLVALAVGLRQGELLGLTWADVELDAGALTVRHALQRVHGRMALVEPKSRTSRRRVALPAIVVAGLRAHRTRQAAKVAAAGPRWQGNAWDLVFTTTIGTPLDGITVTRRFQALLARVGLPHQRFHDLRHACASLLLAQGVAPRVVMETLGHSQISLTLDTYSHVIPELGRAAATRMDELLAGEGSTAA